MKCEDFDDLGQHECPRSLQEGGQPFRVEQICRGLHATIGYHSYSAPPLASSGRPQRAAGAVFYTRDVPLLMRSMKRAALRLLMSGPREAPTIQPIRRTTRCQRW